MSLGGRMMISPEAYHMVPIPCLPPHLAHQPPMACLTRQPNTHTAWATATTTYGGFHPPYQGHYNTMPSLTAPHTLMHKKLTDNSAPTSKKCPSVPLPQLSRTSFHVGYYVPPSVEPGDLYGGLEEVWNQHFELLFRHLPHMWSFGPAETPPSDWHVFKDMAKVRFSCQRCAHGWTSMYGLVVFYYCWDAASNQGLVRFLLTGQKCNQCDVEEFETPMWYPEEAQKVMTNLYHEVAGRIYKLQTPPLIKDRRHGRPRQQHNTTMCEACRQGLCKTTKTSPGLTVTQT
ncbi:receptor-transporting protein 3-like isoform X1 [Scylla paramamosain]|uniref:receptor-transporting protein 3-like isoform X1 n=1 Tax=Scylla paramamosain TaxID=85552 RepID=UPI00308303FF